MTRDEGSGERTGGLLRCRESELGALSLGGKRAPARRGGGCSPWTTAGSLRLLFCGEEGRSRGLGGIDPAAFHGGKMQGIGDSRGCFGVLGKRGALLLLREGE
jgi:hypothetical protein